MKLKRDDLEAHCSRRAAAINRIAPKQAPGKPAAQLADKSDSELLFSAVQQLNELSFRARKCDSAVTFLVMIARLCNAHMWGLLEANPARVAKVVGAVMEFPCNLPLFPKHQRETLQAIKKLTQTELSTHALFKVGTRKPYDPDKIANQVARDCVGKIQRWKSEIEGGIEAQRIIADICQDKPRELPLTSREEEVLALPPYTRQTARRWARVVWACVRDQENGHPERNGLLRELGKARRQQRRKLNSQGKTSPGTQDSEVRTRIGERIQQAVIGLAGRA